MMYHEQYEQVPKNGKIVLCDCGNLIYMYTTKSGKEMPVTVLEGMRFHRFGNYNNNVPIHECSGDRRTSEFCHAIKIQIEPVPEDIASKVTGNLQQQAVIKALRDFSKPRTRSGFKKSMLKQATDYIAGNSTYHNPYSQKQALAIILGR